MTFVYAYGSGENEELGLGDEVRLLKKPRKISLFSLGLSFPANQIIKIACGGQHTLALSSNGVLFSWGNNDEGALGREGQENIPHRVAGTLNEPVTEISVGDSHSVAYNIGSNVFYYWGCYKVSNQEQT